MKASAPPSGTVRAASLSGYIDVAKAAGLDGDAALRRFGLDRAALRSPDGRIPSAAAIALLEYSAGASGCETFGLRMAERRGNPDLGPLGLVLAHQPSLRDVLETTMAHRRLLNDALTLGVEDLGDAALLREDLTIWSPRHPRQSYELAIAILMRMCCAVLGPRWRPLSTHFSHPPPRDDSLHRRMFGPALEFGCEHNGLICDVTDLDRANPAGDAHLLRHARQYVGMLPRTGAGTATNETRRAIQLLLLTQRASIEEVASSLGLHVRTLQRRLDDEGAAFSALLADVRRQVAVRHLRDSDASLTDVAAMLGFGRLSSFTRWFTTEYGVSPSTWRRGPMETAPRPGK